MSQITVSIRLVDGEFREFTEDDAFLQQLRSLQAQGLAGKQLVDRLLTDDWAAPPRSVEITWKDSGGNSFEIRIPYT